jgi:hypothetical protein
MTDDQYARCEIEDQRVADHGTGTDVGHRPCPYPWGLAFFGILDPATPQSGMVDRQSTRNVASTPVGKSVETYANPAAMRTGCYT